ncbi:MAG: hypothetical protein AB7T37_12165 [Dehalococcoidia bacterium]
MRRIVLVFAVLLTSLMPSVALAQDPDDGATDGFTLRIDGDYTLAAGETADTVVVIAGDAVISGSARDVVVINGDLLVNGRIRQQATVVRGTMTVAGSGDVSDVVLVRSDIVREAGSVVRGEVQEEDGAWLYPGAAIFLGLIFIGGAIVITLVAGVAFAAFGGRQLGEAAASMTSKPGQSIGFAAAVIVGAPVVAVIAVATVIGIPVGLTILLVAIPALLLLGAIVAATWLGLLILGRLDSAKRPERPFAPTLLGLVVMLAVMMLPGLGFVGVSLFSLWGMGALVYRIVTGSPTAILPETRVDPTPPAVPADAAP